MFEFMVPVTLKRDANIRTSNVDAVFTAPGRSQALLVNSTGAGRLSLPAGSEVVLCGRHLDNAFFFGFRARRNEPFVGTVVRPKALHQLVAALEEPEVVEVAEEEVAIAAK